MGEKNRDKKNLVSVRIKWSVFGVLLLVSLWMANIEKVCHIETLWPTERITEKFPAPAWSLERLNGDVISLADYRGRIVVINFWATWCAPCVAELPVLESLYQEYKGKQVAFVGISLDTLPKPEVQAFVSKYDLNFPNVLADIEVVRQYGIESIPQTFVINAEGAIDKCFSGLVKRSELSAAIDQLLSQ